MQIRTRGFSLAGVRYGGLRGLTEGLMQCFRRNVPSLDIRWLEREFWGWMARREEPDVAAFHGLMKRKQAASGPRLR